MAGNPAYKSPNSSPLQSEFEAKNDILSSKFLALSPEDYLYQVFPDKSESDELVIVLGTLKDKDGNVEERGTVTRVKLEDVWGITWRSNAYIPYCDFRRNYYHSKTLQRVRAFVVDCDGVTSSRLKSLLKYLWTALPAEPTHIINSGKGVHFIYLLSEPVEVKGRRWSVNSLNKAIQDRFSEFIAVDKHPVVHPYRFPGFMTKINTTATAFKLREPYGFDELMALFKLKPKKTLEGEEKGEKKKAKILVLPNGRRAFFEYVLRRLFLNPPIPGRRHNSFFALGIVAYKCRREVPYEEAYETVEMAYEYMMDKNLHIGFDLKEAYEAFHKGYNNKATRVRWKFLCDLLGWEYRPNKRNGRKREEHLRYLQEIRKIQKKEKEEHIKRLISVGYSKSEIAKMLGMSYRNLNKTYGHLFK